MKCSGSSAAPGHFPETLIVGAALGPSLGACGGLGTGFLDADGAPGGNPVTGGGLDGGPSGGGGRAAGLVPPKQGNIIEFQITVRLLKTIVDLPTITLHLDREALQEQGD